MCKIMEDMRNEAALNRAKKTAIHLIKLGKMYSMCLLAFNYSGQIREKVLKNNRQPQLQSYS